LQEPFFDMPIIETLEALLRPLVLAGVVIGAVSYFLLVRRRQRERDDARQWRASQDRAIARWKKIESTDRRGGG